MRAWLDDLLQGSTFLQALPIELVYGTAMLLAAAILLSFAAVLAGETVWMERRVAGRMQARIGPNRVGPQGLLQFLADALKLLSKEDVVPAGAARTVFLLAPVIVFVGAFVGFAVLPFGYGVVAADMNIGVLLVLAVTSVEVVGVILAGWASNSKWAVLGAMREVAQMVSYEMPLAIAALAIVLLGGTMNLTDLVLQQSGGLWNWYLFRGPFAFLSFFIFGTAALAALKRAPYDLPEAESELVAGFFTEYTGFRFAVFFLAEYAGMILFALLASLLFLGGWDPGFGITLTGPLARWMGVLVLVSKAMALVFVMMWLRWSLPRFRIDKVMYLCYKVLLPWSIVCLLGISLQVLLGHALPDGAVSSWLMGKVTVLYLRRIWSGIVTTAKGLRVTGKHLFEKTYTIQYPEEQPYFSPHERGLHEFEPEKCIICELCAKACPVDCIYIEQEGRGKSATLTRFGIDYSKCLFCSLCIDPCPVDCIHMEQFDLASFERQRGTIIEFTEGEGPWRSAKTSADPRAGLRAHTND